MLILTALMNGNLINCYDGNHDSDELKLASSNNELTCPACGGAYEYCHGAIVQPYFRHKSKDDCNHYSEPETEEHIEGKQKIFEWICKQDGVSDAVLEGWLPETRQRPDIIFKYNGKQYVIEYQCSPIVEEYMCRHGMYKSAGINDIWILGVKKYLNYATEGNGSRRKRDIEKRNRMHYDPTIDMFLLAFSSYPTRFPATSVCGTLDDALECVRAFGYGAFSDKEKVLCMPPDFVKFNGTFCASESGGTKYNRIRNRFTEVARDAFDRISRSAKEAGVYGNIYWDDVSKLLIGSSGRLTGDMPGASYNYKRLGATFKLNYSFTGGIPLWTLYIEFGDVKWYTNEMNTKIFLTFLSGNLPGILKQMANKQKTA
jgi:hypothetical protein